MNVLLILVAGFLVGVGTVEASIVSRTDSVSTFIVSAVISWITYSAAIFIVLTLAGVTW